MNKNKKGLIAAGCAIVVLFLIASGIFLAVSKNKAPSDALEKAKLQLRADVAGTWYCASDRYAGEIPGLLTVDENTLSGTLPGGIRVQTDFEINDSLHLLTADPAGDYLIERVSGSYLKMVDGNSGEVFHLLKRSDAAAPSAEAPAGEWSILVHGGTAVSGECILFENETVTITKNNGASVVYSGAFSTSGDTLQIPAAGLAFRIIPCGEAHLFLLDMKDGYVWEIEKR